MFYNSYITFIIISICILNYIRKYQLAQNEYEDLALQDTGALLKPFNKKDWFRLLTSGFTHVNITHLLMNLYCMYSLGVYLERLIGHPTFTFLILGSIIVGNLFTIFIDQNEVSISCGLSGGIYGLMGFYLFLIIRIYGLYGIIYNQGLLLTIGINILMNFMPGVGWKAHLGGVVFGVLFGIVFTLI